MLERKIEDVIDIWSVEEIDEYSPKEDTDEDNANKPSDFPQQRMFHKVSVKKKNKSIYTSLNREKPLSSIFIFFLWYNE